MLKPTRLRELRERASFSQMELAERSGVSRATIADLELGKRGARPKTRRKLAKALGVEPWELVSHAQGGIRVEQVPRDFD